jgi:hypothetical protein
VQEKERLLSGGIFQSEESRMSSSLSAVPPVTLSAGEKRKFDDIGMTRNGVAPEHSSDHDIWSEFQVLILVSPCLHLFGTQHLHHSN